MIDSNVIKKTKQGHKTIFLTKDATAIPSEDNTVSISLNDESQDPTPVDPNGIDLNVTSTIPPCQKILKTPNWIRLVITIFLVWSYSI